MGIAAGSSAARYIFRSQSVRSSATKLRSQAKVTRCPFRLPSRDPLAHRIFRRPDEVSAFVESMQPYHSVTASALMTSMLTVSRCGYGWLPDGMSRSLDTSSGKRKRNEAGPPGLVDAERAILNSIRSRKNLGIWAHEIKQETELPKNVFDKLIKSLLTRQLIKEVVNIQNKGKKHYMAAEFEPSKEVSGGVWYANGNLDKELVNVMKQLCLRCIRVQKVATLERVHEDLKKQRVVNFEISIQEVSEILNSLVLDNEIIEVKSTGLGEYHSIPIGTICYRFASSPNVAKSTRVGAFASIPCGACPRISLCSPDGVISPTTCVYYTKWLNLDF